MHSVSVATCFANAFDASFMVKRKLIHWQTENILIRFLGLFGYTKNAFYAISSLALCHVIMGSFELIFVHKQCPRMYVT